MKMAVRVIQVAFLLVWPILGCLTSLLFLSARLPEPERSQMAPAVAILGIGVVLLVAIAARPWLRFRKLSFVTADRSSDPAPLPDALLPASGELERLGFRPIGQYQVDTAWPEGPARIYACYASTQDPRIWAHLSLTTERTCFRSDWPYGRSLETVCAPLDVSVAKGELVLPRGMLVLQCSDGIEVAHQLHRRTIELNAPKAGQPIPVADVTGAISVDAVAMARIREFHRTRVIEFLAPVLFVVPAYLALAWATFIG